MNFRKLAILLVLALLGLVAVMTYPNTALMQAVRSVTQPIRTPLKSTASPSPTDNSEPERLAVQTVAPIAALPSPAVRDLLKESEVLAERTVSVSKEGTTHRARLYRTHFKYPLIRQDEWFTTPALGSTTATQQRELYSVADHAMVRFPAEMTEEQISTWAASHLFTVRKRFRTERLHLIANEKPTLDAADSVLLTFSKAFPAEAAAANTPQPIAERDYLHFPTLTPNDSSYSQLWGLHNTGQSGGIADADIDAPEAWEYGTGDRAVLVGIIDTGYDRTHPDLSANSWTNPREIAGNSIDDDRNGFVDDTIGWDFFSDDANPADENGHGTHCGGTIGATGNNGSGVVGVNWQVSMVGIRFLGSGGGSTSDAIESVNYATGIGCSLTSNSWGGGGFSQMLLDAIERGGTAGIPFVAAAGNSSANTDIGAHYPSTYASAAVISVGSMTASEQVSSFSNYGATTVDLFAPGSSIYSTYPGSGYSSLSGTSMATPHVAGAIALMKSLSPSTTLAALKTQLLASVDARTVYAGRCVSGGRLNLQRFLEPYSGPRPVVTDYTLAEGTGANSDGVLNPGEPARLTFTITNRGSVATGAFTATLASTTSPSRLTLTTDTVQLASLAPGGVVTPTQALEFSIASPLTTPHTESLALRLTFGSPATVVTRVIPLTVHTTTRLTGTVTNAEDGLPVTGATVSVSGPRTLTQAVNADGSYALTLVDGTFSISATAPGYLTSSSLSKTLPPDAAGVDFQLRKPDLRLSPTSISTTLAAGDAATQTVSLTNRGSADLDWSAILTGQNYTAATPLSDVLRELDTNSSAITSLIPNRYPFSEGTTGNNIVDGGNDMYDGGNYLNTNLAIALNYSDGRISSAPGTSYFTRKYAPGLFIFAADFVGVDSFRISGNVGADGSGTASASVLERTSGGQQFRGFIKRVYNAGDPSVNHLIIVQDRPSSAHTWSTNTDDDFHQVTGLAGNTRIYYLLFASAGGGFVSDAQFGAIMDAFLLHTSSANLGWATLDPAQGRILPTGSTAMAVALNARHLPPGTYTADADFTTNIPGNPSIRLPIQLRVTGAPGIQATPPAVAYGNVPLNYTVDENVQITNTGSDPLTLSQIQVQGAGFTLPNLLPTAPIAPGSSAYITVRHHRTTVGSSTGTLSIASNDPTEPTLSIPLTATDTLPPDVRLSHNAYRVTLREGQVDSRSLTLANRGQGPMDWSYAIRYDTGSNWCTLPGFVTHNTLAAGASAALPLRFSAVGLAPGQYTGQLTITTRDADTPFSTVDLIFTVQEASVLAVSPTSLTFPPCFAYDYSGVLLRLTNNGSMNMVVYGCLPQTAGPFRCVTNFPFVLDAGSSVDLNVTFTPTRVGRHTGTMIVLCSGSTRRVYVPVSGEATLGPVASISPQRIAFSADPGTVTTHNLTLKNTGGADMDWSAGALIGDMGVSFSPSSGLVLPGQSAVIQMSVDTTGTGAGRRSMTAQIVTTDPRRTSIPIGITATVARKPQLSLSTTSITFADTWRGDTKYMPLTLTNSGNAPVIIRSFAGLTEPFSYSWDLPYTLPAGQSIILYLGYTPTTVGSSTATLTIASNASSAPSQTVQLSGNAVLGPVIETTPTSYALTVNPGTTEQRALSIRNAGGAPLTWSTAVQTVSALSTTLPATAATTVEQDGKTLSLPASPALELPLAPLTGLRVGYANASTTFRSDLITRGATVSAFITPFTSANLAGYDVIYLDDNQLPSLTSAEVTALRTWVSSGKSLLLCADDSSSMANLNALQAGTGMTSSHVNYRDFTTTTFYTHPTTAGLTSITQYAAGGAYTLTSPAVAVMTDGPAARVFAAASTLGSGRIFAVGNELDFNTDTQNRQFNQQVVEWLAQTRAGLTLTVTPASGTTAVARSTAAQVQFKVGEGQPAGTIRRSLRITSNAPETPTLDLPVTITVPSGGVLAAVEPVAAFSPAFTGFSQTLQIILKNLGNEALSVSALTPSDPSVTLTGVTYPLSLAVGEERRVTLHWLPTSPSSLSASLTATSDALGSFSLPITGTATNPPISSIDTTPISLTVDPGSSQTHDILLGNTGGSVLNFSSTLAGSASTFISRSPTSGTVSPGASTTLRLTVAPSGSSIGLYSATLTLSTNQPDRSTISIPISITVRSKPRVLVASSVSFGSLFAHLSTTQALQITNGGNDALSITGITAPSAPFGRVSTNNALALAPGASFTYTLSYSPTSPGSHSGSFTFSTNDTSQPSVSIALTGDATSGPEANVNPTSLAVTLDPGSTATRSITLSNTGGATLNWATNAQNGSTGSLGSAGILPVSGNNGSAGILPVSSSPSVISTPIQDKDRILPQYADLTGISIAVAPRVSMALATDLHARGATVTQLSGSLTAASLAPYQILLSDENLYLTTTEVAAIRTWVQSGGCLFIASYASHYYPTSDLLLNTGITPVSRFAYTATTTNITSHPITQGFSSYTPSVSYTYSDLDVTGSATTLIRRTVGWTIAALTRYGAGSIFVSTDQLLSYPAGANAALAHQAIDWLATNSGGVSLTVAPSSGAVPAAGSATLTASIQTTTSTPAGTSSRVLRFTTNDPRRTTLDLPVAVTVNAYPRLSSGATSLTYAQLWTGQSSTQTLTLSNTGNSPVTISSATFTTGSSYSITGQSFPLSIAAGQSQNLTVRFAPTSAGSHPDTLTLASNATNAPSLPITLSGSAVRGPEISADPSSLTLNIAPGASGTLTTTIRNTGGATLSCIESFINFTAGAPLLILPTNASSYGIAPGGSFSRSFTFQVAPQATPRTITGTLRIRSNDPVTTNYDIPISIVFPAAPSATLTPATLDLGHVLLGQSTTRTLALENTGNVTLALQAPTSTHPTFTATAASSIAAYSSQQVSVTFTPTQSGPVSSSLSLATDQTPALTAQVTGIGSSIIASPTSISVAQANNSPAVDTPLTISTSSPSLAWTLASSPAASWLSLSSTSGTGSGSVTVTINPSGLSANSTHTTSLILTAGSDSMTVPVQLQVQGTLNITKLQSDSQRPVIYALHHDLQAPYHSSVLWITPSTGAIAHRYDLGTVAHDLTHQPLDDHLYLLTGSNRTTLTVLRRSTPSALVRNVTLGNNIRQIEAGPSNRVLFGFPGGGNMNMSDATTGNSVTSVSYVLNTFLSRPLLGSYYLIFDPFGDTFRSGVCAIGMNSSQLNLNSRFQTVYPNVPRSTLIAAAEDMSRHFYLGRVFSGTTLNEERNLGSPIYACSPTGHLAYTHNTAYLSATGAVAFSLNLSSTLAAASVDGRHVIQFDTTNRVLRPTTVPSAHVTPYVANGSTGSAGILPVQSQVFTHTFSPPTGSTSYQLQVERSKDGGKTWQVLTEDRDYSVDKIEATPTGPYSAALRFPSTPSRTDKFRLTASP